MNEDKARELAQQFGVRMCDENGETHGEELYCLGLDDIIDMAKVLAQPEQEPVAWLQFRDNEPPVVAPRNLGTPVFLGIRGGLAHDAGEKP